MLLLSVSTLLFSCVHPKVTYETNPTEDYDGHIKFRLAATRLVIGERIADPTDAKKTTVKINEMKTVNVSQASILQVPREYEGSVYSIIPQSQWLWTVETKLSVTYFDNTRLVQKLGTQVEDHRIQAIQAAGTIAKAIIIGFIAAPPARDEIQIPVAIDADPAQNTWQELPSNPGWVYLVSSKNPNPEPDAVKRDEYFQKYEDRRFSLFSSTRTLPTSSCREAKLELGRLVFDNPEKGNKTDEAYREEIRAIVDKKLKEPHISLENKIELPLMLADYRYLRTYELPDKGAISLHTLCGADITTEKSDSPTSLEILAEMVKQAKDIKDSQKEP
jgi:hypothetical protein